MGILDEIEGHAMQTARLQARADTVSRQAQAYDLFARKRAGKLFAVAAIGALIPFLGWGVTMACWLFSSEYLRTLDPKKSGSNAAIVGFGWGLLTMSIPWGTYALGFHGAESVEMIIFYVLAGIMTYWTFTAWRGAVKASMIAREAADHIASQN